MRIWAQLTLSSATFIITPRGLVHGIVIINVELLSFSPKLATMLFVIVRIYILCYRVICNCKNILCLCVSYVTVLICFIIISLMRCLNFKGM